MHKYPALHNAMWPGLVGKGAGRRAADRSRHDARPDRRRRGRRRQVRRRRSVPVRPARQHRLDRRRPEAARRQGRARRTWSSARWWRRSGRRPAAARRWAATTERKAFLTQVRKACAIGRKLRDLGIRQYGVIRIDSAASPADWAKDPGRQHEEDRRDVPRRRRHRRGLRRAARRRRGDLLGRHAQLEAQRRAARSWSDRPKTRRLPGRHGAHAALHAGLQRARGSRSCPEDFDWSDRTTLDDALQKMTRALRPWTIDFHVAQNDAHGQGLRLARQDRPPLPAASIRTASSTSSSTPATGCATTTGKPTRSVRAHLLGRLHVPQRDDDAAADLERHPRRR